MPASAESGRAAPPPRTGKIASSSPPPWKRLALVLHLRDLKAEAAAASLPLSEACSSHDKDPDPVSTVSFEGTDAGAMT